MAWKNQPSVFFGRPQISTTLRSFQSVSAELAQLVDAIDDALPGCGRPSGTARRCGRRGPACATRGRRPPTASWPSRPTSVMSRSPSRFVCSRPRSRRACARRAGRRRGRGRGRRPVWERSARVRESRIARLAFLPSPSALHFRTLHSHVRRRPPACPPTTTCPPPSPASGPRSMTQSAVLITSRLCSIDDDRVAQIDQPVAARRAACAMSSKCRPVVGSSSR